MILPNIIIENQGAFVMERKTTDNIMIVHELCHCLKNRRKWRHGIAALKLDMTKAYGILE